MSTLAFREQFPDCVMVSDVTRAKTSATSKRVGAGRWRKGAKLTEEHKAHLSSVMTGEGNPFFGKHHTLATKRLLAENHADVTGDKNPFRRAMQNEQYRVEYIDRRKASYEAKKVSDPEWYKRLCDTRSQATAQAHFDGKLTSYGRGHEQGWYLSFKSIEPIYYRSSYERCLLELCDETDAISSVESAGFSIAYVDETGHSRRYIPDFVVNGVILIEVKAEFALSDDRIRRKLEAARTYCVTHDMQFMIVSVRDEFIVDLTDRYLSLHG